MHRHIRIMVTALVAMMFAGVGIAARTSDAQTSRRCFEETGFCIEGRIRSFWEQNGGLPVFGYPLAAQGEITVEGQRFQAQQFQRNRLELHPEKAAPYDVLLGRLGADRLAQLGRSWQQYPAEQPQANCRYFEQTGHNVCGAILRAWRANGLEFDGKNGKSEGEHLALFGLPLSGPVTETLEGKQYTVQWFERARFELHPENQPPYDVLLGLLGTETTTSATTPQPRKPTATPKPKAPTATPTPEASAMKRREQPPGGVAVDGSTVDDEVPCDNTGSALGANTASFELSEARIAQRIKICLDAPFDPAQPLQVTEQRPGKTSTYAAPIYAGGDGGGYWRYVAEQGFPAGAYTFTLTQNNAKATLLITNMLTDNDNNPRMAVHNKRYTRGDKVVFTLAGFAAGQTIPLYLYGDVACPDSSNNNSDPARACYMTSFQTVADGRGEATFRITTLADDPTGHYFLDFRGNTPNGFLNTFWLD